MSGRSLAGHLLARAALIVTFSFLLLPGLAGAAEPPAGLDTKALWLAEGEGLLKVNTANLEIELEIAADRVRAVAVDPRRRHVWVHTGQRLAAFDFTGASVGGFALAGEDRGGIVGHLLGRGHFGDVQLTVEPESGDVYLGEDDTVRRLSPAGVERFRVELRREIEAIALDRQREVLWLADDRGAVRAVDALGNVTEPLPRARHRRVEALTYSPAQDAFYLALRRSMVRVGPDGTRQLSAPVGHLQALDADGADGVWGIGRFQLVHITAQGELDVEVFPGLRGRLVGTLDHLSADPSDGSVWVANRLRAAHFAADGTLIDVQERTSARGLPAFLRDLVLYADVRAPELEFLSPDPETWLADKRPTLGLRHSRDADLDTLAVTADGEALAVDCATLDPGADDPRPLTEDSECSPKQDLPEGELALEATIDDFAGNTSEAAEHTVRIDTVPPEITIDSPEAGLITNEPDQTLAGEISEPADLSLDGEPLAVDDDDRFSRTVTLDEGANTFTLTAVDRAGNTTDDTLTATLDTEPPPQPDADGIGIDPVEDGSATITGGPGSVEPGTEVTVVNTRTGETVTVTADDEGAFKAEIAADGGDDLRIVSRDAAGNTSEELKTAVPRANQPPQLAALDDRTVEPGNTLTVELEASDPDGDALTFSVRPLPLPEGASFDMDTGRLRFAPGLGQVGSFELTFRVTDGEFTTQRSATITVAEPDPEAPTALTGRVMDANAASSDESLPVVGATISLRGSGAETTTDESGRFELTGVPAGEQVLDIDASTAEPAPDGSSYGGFREELVLTANVTKTIERPFFLPRLDATSATKVNPDETTMVENTEEEVTLEVPANSAKNEDGSDFTGELSVSRVPRGFAPMELPDTLDPGMLVTIQPVGVRFDTPAPISFPNRNDLAPGSEVNLWSLDAEDGTFKVTGTGRVSDDGERIVTIEGGIRSADWHATLPPSGQGDGDVEEAPSDNDEPDCKDMQDAGSTVTSKSGCLRTTVSLPAHLSQGIDRALTFTYDSQRANPQPVIPFNSTISRRAAVPDVFSYQISVGGTEQGREIFLSTDGFSESRDETLRGAATFDASDLPTGILPYSVRLTSHYGDSRVSSRIRGDVPLVNGQDSPIGAGWGVAGLSRLHTDDSGRVLITSGNGGHTVFRPQGALPRVETSGDPIELIEPPPSVQVGALSGELKIFIERRDFVLPDNVPVDVTEPGRVSGNTNTPLQEIPAGQPVNSYFVHQPNRQGRQTTTITFPQPILGVVGTETNSDRKDAANDIIGLADTVYGRPNESGENDYNNDDFFEISEDRRSLTVNTHTTCCVDNLRVLTEPTQAGTGGQFRSPDGDTSELVRNDDGSFTRTFENGTTVDYNAEGPHTRTVDRNGNTTTYEYDSQNRLVRVTDPAGRTTQLAYSGGRLSQVTDPAGRVTRFSHDANGDLIEVQLPDGSTRSFSYDDQHLMTAETDGRGFTVEREYGPAGRLRKVTLPDGSVRRAREAQTVGLVMPDSNAGTADDPASIDRPDEALASFADGEGRTRKVETDKFGTAKTITDATGLTTRIERDKDGNPVRTESPNGAVTERTFDDNDNVTSVTDQVVGGTTRFTYGPFAQVTSVEDSQGNVTRFNYDDRGNLTETITPEGRVTAITYRDDGQPETLTTPRGLQVRFGYNENGNLTRIARGPGDSARVMELSRTSEGYIASSTDALGQTVSFDYDSQGRITQKTLPDGRVIGIEYDENGNLVAIQPPGRPEHRFEYTSTDQQSEYDPPDVGLSNDTTQRSYNRAQQLERIVRPDGQAIDFSYDEGGRLAERAIPRGSTTFGYDPDTGNLVRIDTADQTLSLGYNKDLLTTRTWSGTISGSVEESFDTERRVVERTVNGASPIGFSHDGDGLRTGAGALTIDRTAAGGLVAGTTLNGVSGTRSHNGFAELTSRSVDAGGSAVYDVSYTRDKLGRIVEETESVGGETHTFTYSYDEAGRLTEVTRDGTVRHTYSYDKNGNRLEHVGPSGTETGSYDAQDRLTTYDGQSYSYTAAGELESKTTDAGTTTYDYDVLGNLRAVTLPDGTGIEYVIDGRNRRVGKKVDGELVQGFLYKDGLNPVAELDGSSDYAESDGSGIALDPDNVEARFVYGNKANVPAYMIKGGTTYRIVSDQLGSVRLVINTSTGEIAQRMDYSPFGRVVTDTNPGFQPFGFAGGLYDPDTGLVRFGARDYDPEIGRWTTKDPILFSGGSVNLYGYVLNEPINSIDPPGLAQAVQNSHKMLKASLKDLKNQRKELQRELEEARRKLRCLDNLVDRRLEGRRQDSINNVITTLLTTFAFKKGAIPVPTPGFGGRVIRPPLEHVQDRRDAQRENVQDIEEEIQDRIENIGEIRGIIQDVE